MMYRLKMPKHIKYLGIATADRMYLCLHLIKLRTRLTKLALRHIMRSEWGLSRRAAVYEYAEHFAACVWVCVFYLYQQVALSVYLSLGGVYLCCKTI